MSLPLHWSVLPADATSPCSAARNLTALELLEAQEDLNVLHHEGRVNHSQELARIEHKLDLLLNLVGELIFQQRNAAAVSPLLIGLHGMAWPETKKISQEHTIIIELFLHPHTPSLCLSGKVVDTVTKNTQTWYVIKFDDPGDAVTALFEKWIFRQHRRSIAKNRQ